SVEFHIERVIRRDILLSLCVLKRILTVLQLEDGQEHLAK
ncbi:MAG: hypothetical protein RLZZ74_2592, partial [Cyanobacteriota bacterium]